LLRTPPEAQTLIDQHRISLLRAPWREPPRAVRNPSLLVVELERQKIVVTMAASNSQSRAGDEHTRAWEAPFVDAVAERYVREIAGTDIADRGEPASSVFLAFFAPIRASWGTDTPRPL